MEIAFQNSNQKSSPGLDGIDCKIIKALLENGKEIFLNIFNRIFFCQYVSEEWKRFMVFCIPKQGKNLKFQPISLSSCLCKVLERMIANRLNWFLEHHKLLTNSQFGFRRGMECIDNLMILRSRIQLGFQSNLSTLASFLTLRQPMIT